ncbi:MAG: triple tyrosine motif-containing protein, partial [Flavobacteriales bacterium]
NECNGERFNNVNSSLEDKYGNIWMATSGSGILRWDGHSLVKYASNQGLKNNEVFTLYQNEAGSIYAGTKGDGLWVCNSDSIRQVKPNDEFPSIIYPVIEHGNYVYIGGYGKGIWRGDQQLVNWEKIEGGPESVASFLQHEDIILAGSGSGLYGVRDNQAYTIFNKKNGLKMEDFFPQALTMHGDLLYGATGNVLSIMDVNHIQPMRPYVTGRMEDDVFIPLKGSEDLEFDYAHNSPEFVIGVLPDIFVAGSTTLRYKLEGYHDRWQDASQPGIFQVDNLSEGNYVLHVGCDDGNGAFAQANPVSFTIEPPLYRTKTAYFSYFLFFGVIVYSVSTARTRQLQKRNAALEKTVAERTSEIRTQKDIIEKQKAEVDQQNDLLALRNSEILESITYASGLQRAILPADDTLQQLLGEYFLMYRPRDIVAGDFYWFERINPGNAGVLNLLAVADCTGHGVPGAMVSVVCSNAINRAVNEFGFSQPNLILDKARELVIENFERSTSVVHVGLWI